MKFEHTEVWGFEHAFRGMRNPKNSWDRSDSNFNGDEYCFDHDQDLCELCNYFDGWSRPCLPYIGPNDMKLAQTLIRGGSEHRKFMRQIFVSVDITAPLLWWKEFDTYKVGTAANSTSTMHKITSAPITKECFEPRAFENEIEGCPNYLNTEYSIEYCELMRKKYLETKDKRYWNELIYWLPESWLQTRTVTMNYENIYSMIRQRRNHKLNEWSDKDDPTKPNFISWARTLPYAKELLFLDLEEGTNE